MPVGLTAITDCFSTDNQGAAVAAADVTGNGKPDLVVLIIDNPVGQTQVPGWIVRVAHRLHNRDAAPSLSDLSGPARLVECAISVITNT